MITVTTTDPSEAAAVAPLLTALPAGLDYQVLCLGRVFAERSQQGVRREPQWGDEPETRG